MIRVIL